MINTLIGFYINSSMKNNDNSFLGMNLYIQNILFEITIIYDQ